MQNLFYEVLYRYFFNSLQIVIEEAALYQQVGQDYPAGTAVETLSISY